MTDLQREPMTNSELYQSIREIVIPRLLTPGAEEYHAPHTEHPLGKVATKIVDLLTNKVGSAEELGVQAGDAPSVLAAVVDMRGKPPANTDSEAHMITFMNRFAGVPFPQIVDLLSRRKTNPIEHKRLSDNFRTTFLNRAVLAYELRPAEKKHPLGRVGLLAQYLQSDDLTVTWQPVSVRKENKAGIYPDKVIAVRIVDDLYAKIMSGQTVPEMRLNTILTVTLQSAVESALLSPKESQLLRECMDTEDQQHTEESQAMFDKLDKMIANRVPMMRLETGKKRKKQIIIEKILAAFAKGQRPVKLIEQDVYRSKHDYPNGMCENIDPRHTKSYLVAGLQMVFRTEGKSIEGRGRKRAD